MASNEPGYFRVGLILILGVLAITMVGIYFGGLGKERDFFQAETYYVKPVSGLSVGSSVNFRGVQVGTVKEISFVGTEYREAEEKDWQKVVVRMALDVSKFRIDPAHGVSPKDVIAGYVAKGLHATVSASGVTGLSRVELDFPTSSIKNETISWKPKTLAIPPSLSLLDSASDSATRILNQIDTMDLKSGWEGIIAISGELNALVRNLNELVSREQGAVNRILENLEDATSKLKDAADQIKSNPASLLRANDPAPLRETSSSL